MRHTIKFERGIPMSENEPKYLGIYRECMKQAEKAGASITQEAYRKHGNLSHLKNFSNSTNIIQWIHLSDAVERGSIHPLEAWDTIAMGYVAEHLKVRHSRYKDRL